MDIAGTQSIWLSIATINWTMGWHCYFSLLTGTDASVTVDWGDGSRKGSYTSRGKWMEVTHDYKNYKEENTYEIRIESDKPIIGFESFNFDIRTRALDVSRCNSLKYLVADNVPKLDVRGNVRLESLRSKFSTFGELDLSHNTELLTLDCSCCAHLKQLNLSSCTKLEKLDCSFNPLLTKIGIGNKSSLKSICFDNTPLSGKSLLYIGKIISSNNASAL